MCKRRKKQKKTRSYFLFVLLILPLNLFLLNKNPDMNGVVNGDFEGVAHLQMQ